MKSITRLVTAEVAVTRAFRKRTLMKRFTLFLVAFAAIAGLVAFVSKDQPERSRR